ncbi:Uma2 family endonuclease [Leptolyngbya sp. AN02str]|uniref:Uma2 family endonuclease n=1 Tax=Leptolyngbya sp. AN02str TaxID=3423363 RepID=UPI003D3171E6
MVSLTLPLVLETAEVHLTDEQFYQLCLSNPDLSIERSAKGALIVMSPVGGEGGSYEMELGADLTLWNRQTNLGKTFSSSTLFKLPTGGDRSLLGLVAGSGVALTHRFVERSHFRTRQSKERLWCWVSFANAHLVMRAHSGDHSPFRH